MKGKKTAILALGLLALSLIWTAMVIGQNTVTRPLELTITESSTIPLEQTNLTILKLTGAVHGGDATIWLIAPDAQYLIYRTETPQHSVHTEKSSYASGESVTAITTPESAATFWLDDGSMMPVEQTFLPPGPGTYTLYALIGEGTEKVSTTFTVREDSDVSLDVPRESGISFTEACADTCSFSANGDMVLRVELSEGATLELESITTNRVTNTPPVQTAPIPDLTLSTGTNITIDLAEHFSDPDGDRLSYTATVPGAETAISGSSLTITPTAAGTYDVLIYASDGEELVPSTPFTLTITEPLVEIGKPVRITYKAPPGARITIPEDALGISVTDRQGRPEKSEKGPRDLPKGRTFDVSYELPGPTKNEERRVDGKRVTIASPHHFTNVRASTALETPAPASSISLYWHEEARTLPFTPIDADGDGLAEEIAWIVPHLSNQTFDITITILNVHSYPMLGGNWTVGFTTNGFADLRVTATDDPAYTPVITRWTDSPENEGYDLQLLSVTCDGVPQAYAWEGSSCLENSCSILLDDYSCAGTSELTSKVLLARKHVLNFTYGDQQAYAYNTLTNVPVVSNVVLNSSDGSNSTSGNLTLFYDTSDGDGDTVRAAVDWRVNDASINVINYNFDVNNSGGANKTRSYSSHNNGTVTGAIWNATGGWNGSGAYELWNTSTYISIPQSTTWTNALFSTASSIDVWIKPRNVTATQMIFSSYSDDTCSNLDRGVKLFLQDSKIHYSTAGTTAPQSINTSSVISTPNSWYRITVTQSGTTARIYINGNLASTGTTVNAVNPSRSAFIGLNEGHWADGCEGYSGTAFTTPFNGTIDSFLLWNRALSPEQIASAYNNETRMVTQELYPGQAWSACVTPNDETQDGSTTCQNLQLEGSTCRNINGTHILENNVTSTGTCFTINTSDTTLDCQGYAINYASTNGYGINITNVTNVTIKNCNIIQNSASTGGSYAIYSNASVTIRNNTVRTSISSSTAVYLVGGSHSITNNSITAAGSNSYGIYFSYPSKNHIIDGNTINATTQGIQSNAALNDSSINNNTIYSSGILLTNPTNTSVTSNSLNGSGAISFSSTSSYNNTIRDNTILTTGTIGLQVGGSTNTQISGNSIIVTNPNGVGLSVSSSGSYNNATGNLINVTGSTSTGISVATASNRFSNNIVSATTGFSFTSTNQYNQTLINNQFFNGKPIEFLSSPAVTLFTHSITNNTDNGKPIVYIRTQNNYNLSDNASIGQIIIVNSTNARVTNITLTNASIESWYSSNLTLANSTISTGRTGENAASFISTSGHVTNNSINTSVGTGINLITSTLNITDNTIVLLPGSTYGISANSASDRNQIVRNNITGTANSITAIYIGQGRYANISHNKIRLTGSSANGISLAGAVGVQYSNITSNIINTSGSSSSGINIAGQGSDTVTNNTVDAANIALSIGAVGTFTSNYLRGANGISIDALSGNTVTYNTIIGTSSYAFRTSSSSQSTTILMFNNITSTTTAVYLLNARNWNVTDNNITASNGHGISFGTNSQGGTYANNIINAAGAGNNGLYLSSMTNGLFENNTVTSTGSAVNLAVGSITGNTFRNNYLYSSASMPVSINSGANMWNGTFQNTTNIIGGTLLGGNWYGNGTNTGYSQTCSDANLDGICDSRYSMNSVNNDSYPLTVPRVNACANITLPGTYTLLNNVSSDGTCFAIQANDVTLDCAGYTINYSMTTSGYGIDAYTSTPNRTTIKNCRLLQLRTDIAPSYAIGLRSINTTIRNVTIESNGSSAYGIFSQNSNLLVADSQIRTPLGSGSAAMFFSAGTGIVENSSISSLSHGVNINSASVNFTDVNITATSTSGYAFYLDTNAIVTVTNSRINQTGTYGTGVQLSGASGTFINNTITSPYLGINVPGAASMSAINNTFIQNVPIFISTSLSASTIGAFTITDNTDNGKQLLFIKNQDGYTLDGNTSIGQVIIANSNNTLLRNMQLANASFTVFYGSNTTIDNVTINTTRLSETPIYISGGNASIANSALRTSSATYYGVAFRSVSSSRLINSRVNNTGGSNAVAVYLFSASNVLIANNTIDTPTAGSPKSIALSGSTFATIANNTINSYAYGLQLASGSTGAVLNNNTISAIYAVDLSSNNATITNNRMYITGSTCNGIYASSITIANISGNHLDTAGSSCSAIRLTTSTNVTVYNNTFDVGGSNNIAVYISSSSRNNRIEYNNMTVESINTAGVSIDSSYNTTIAHNTFDGPYLGKTINLYLADNSSFIGNAFTGFHSETQTLYLRYSQNLFFADSALPDTSGIYMYSNGATNNVTFLNITFNSSRITFYDGTDTTNLITQKWRVSANVTYANATPAQSATFSITDVNSTVVATNLTPANGLLHYNITGAIYGPTSNTTYSNFTFQASKATYHYNRSSSNLTADQALRFTLALDNLPQTSARISPASPLDTDTLQGFCNATDADNDTITYTYTWFKDSVLNSTGTTAALAQGIETSIGNTTTGAGQNWTLQCLADDSMMTNASNTSVFVLYATALNQTTSPSYATLTTLSVTGNFTYVNGTPFSGDISTNISNSTYSIVKSCAGSLCTVSFTSSELSPGNYTITTSAANASAYAQPQSATTSVYLRAPAASGTFSVQNVTITGALAGQQYSFLQNITLTNSIASTMLDPAINVSGTSAYIVSVENLTTNCTSLDIGGSCYTTFNITAAADMPISTLAGPTFQASWTDLNGSSRTLSGTMSMTVMGNPQFTLNVTGINLTDNLGSPTVIPVILNNTGNVRLGTAGSAPNSIFVTYTQSTMPAEWISFSSANSQWEDADCGQNDCFDTINTGSSADLSINITPTTYVPGTYTGTITIAAYAAGANQANRTIDVSVTIASGLSSTPDLAINDSLGASVLRNITITNDGTAPVTNITPATAGVPAGWVSFSSNSTYWNGTGFTRIPEHTTATLVVNTTVQDYTAANISGTILLESAEGVDTNNTITISIAPALGTNTTLINITEGLSDGSLNQLSVSSDGNTPLTQAIISYTETTLPAAWVSFASSGTWSTDRWSSIEQSASRILNVSVTPQAFVPGIYTGTITITTAEALTREIILTLTIDPALTFSATAPTIAHGTSTTLNLTMNASGNAPLQDVNLTLSNGTIPAGWVTLSRGGSSGATLSIGTITEGTAPGANITITVPAHYAPGTYSGTLIAQTGNNGDITTPLTITVPADSSWHIIAPENTTDEFLLNTGGYLSAILINNTGNVPLNFTVAYDTSHNAGGDICADYFCLGNPISTFNPSHILAAPGAVANLSVYTISWPDTQTDVGVAITLANASGSPASRTVTRVFDIMNAPPQLVTLTTLPNTYAELNTSITLYAVASDDEDIALTKGMNLSTAQFTVTAPNGTQYAITSVNSWDDNDEEGTEMDRKKFNASFSAIPAAGTYNLSFTITDKSGNAMAANLAQFTVVGNTTLTVSAAGTSVTVTNLEGQDGTLRLNVTNTGMIRAFSVNASATGNFSSNTTTIGTIASNASSLVDILTTIPAGTDPGNYTIIPTVAWQQPDGSVQSAQGAASIVSVAATPEVRIPASIDVAISHGMNGSLTLRVNSTGNVNYQQARATYYASTLPAAWVSFNPSVQTTTKTLATLAESTSTDVPLYITIPAGTPPGTYSGTINITSDDGTYNSSRFKQANVSVIVPIDGRWSYTITSTRTDFSLNQAGRFANITLSNAGNANLTFILGYTPAGTTDFTAYPALIPFDTTVNGTSVNPTSVTVGPASNATFTLYQASSNMELLGIGINLSMANASASPSANATLITLNIIEAAPAITGFLHSSIVELNMPLAIKTMVEDDAGINTSALTLNITRPGGASSLAAGTPTAENTTLNNSYIRMNFTSIYSTTTAVGTYTINAQVSDLAGKNGTASSNFTVVGQTTMAVAGQARTNSTNITAASGQTVSIPLNYSNTGSVSAYNITISLIGPWTSTTTGVASMSAQATGQAAINVSVPAATAPVNQTFTPQLSWTQPDGSLTSVNGTPITLEVRPNPVVRLAGYNETLTVTHGQAVQSVVIVQSIGNTNATSIEFALRNNSPELTVNLSANTIATLAAGANTTVTITTAATAGTPAGLYGYDIRVRTDGNSQYTDSFRTNVTVPVNMTWTSVSNVTVHGVSNQPLQDELTITSIANQQLTLDISLSGIIADTGIMRLDTTRLTLPALGTATVRLNHTSPNANANYSGQLTVDDNVGPLVDIDISYQSHIANLSIISVTPASGITPGTNITFTTQTVFDTTPITEDIVFTISINGTSCPTLNTTASGNDSVTICQAPALADGMTHTATVYATYTNIHGTIPLYKSTTIAYTDTTAPRINTTQGTESPLDSTLLLNATATDNTAVDAVQVTFTAPDGMNTTFGLNSTGGSEFQHLIDVSSHFTTPGIYTLTYFANDTSGNSNTTRQQMELYRNMTLAGTIVDLNDLPIPVNFTLRGIRNYTFSTDSNGTYNTTIRTSTYNMTMQVLGFTVRISDAEFFDQPESFISIDRLASSDVNLIGALEGFSIMGNLSGNASVSRHYNSSQVRIEENVRIYQCTQWNFTYRRCGGIWWQQLPSTVNVISDTINSTIIDLTPYNSSAIMMTELPAAGGVDLYLPTKQINVTAPHDQTTVGSMDIQSIGTQPANSLRVSCTSGTVCSAFTLSFETIDTIQAGAVDTMDISITVPESYPPGNYTGTLQLSSGQEIEGFVLLVTVPEDRSTTASMSRSLVTVGTGISGTYGTLTVANIGNVQNTIALAVNSTDITITPSSVTLTPGANTTASVRYTSPAAVGKHDYLITAGTATRTISLNVTHGSAITGVWPSTNLSAGDTILINASASYHGIALISDVAWSASVDGIACANLTSNYTTTWELRCAVPAMTQDTGHTLSVEASFQGGRAVHTAPIVYRDVFAPTIINITQSHDRYAGLARINATIGDDSGLRNATMTITSAAGTTIPATTSFTNTTVSSVANMTQVGDYTLTYTLTDTEGNIAVLNRTFEIYQETAFTGIVRGKNDTGVSGVSFVFYKWEDDTATTIAADGNGNYDGVIHDRTYARVDVQTADTTITLRNVNATTLADQFHMYALNMSRIAIANTGSEIMGFAVETALSLSGSITFEFTPSAVGDPAALKVYKCSSWNYEEERCNDIYWTFVNSTLGNGHVTLNFTGFSAYVLAEAATPSYVVGDGVCSLEAGETYIISADCPTPAATGSTSSGGGGGGGGGGGAAGLTADQMRKILAEQQANLSDKLKIDPTELQRELYAGEEALSRIYLKNLANTSMTVSAEASPELLGLVTIDEQSVTLEPDGQTTLTVRFNIPVTAGPGVTYGYLLLKSAERESKVLVEIRVLESADQQPAVKITPLLKNVHPGETLKLQAEITQPTNVPEEFNLTTQLIRTKLNEEIITVDKSYTLSDNHVDLIELAIPEDAVLDEYFVRSVLRWTDERGIAHETSDSTPITVTGVPFVEQGKAIMAYPVWLFNVGQLLLAALLLSLCGAGYYGYHVFKERRKRYHLPVEANLLPKPGERSGFIGMLAETNIRTFFDLDSLTTHALVAGSTGGGKTVSAQVLVEEALQHNIAVVVFDPTAQWTGFLRPCDDERMLNHYGKFSLSKSDRKAFNGNIKVIKNAREIIDLKNIAKPGEITIFALNQMDLKDMDIFVTNTIRQVFKSNYEETPQLQMLLVYDEVHRLLPKFGGSGAGLMQVERACREFRKWGIGMVLVSQVLSDFIGEIKANINTEVQVRTRDEGDLKRLSMKYGEELLHAVVKANVGTGLMQNSAYNRGRPYMVEFRPLLHSTKRLSDKELGQYHVYNERIDEVAFQVAQLKEMGQDTFDLELELKLALEKLKKGDFSVTDIYLEGLESHLKKLWLQLRKVPKKRVVQLVPEKELQEAIAVAQREHAKTLAGQAPVSAPTAVPSELRDDDPHRKDAAKADAEKMEKAAAARAEGKAVKASAKAPKPTTPEQEIARLKRLAAAGKLSRTGRLKFQSLEADYKVAKAKKDKAKMERIGNALQSIE